MVYLQAVQDGVDIISLSLGPTSAPTGVSTFLNVFDVELLFAVKAGVFVAQAAGNSGPAQTSILSFSPWITSVAASITDRTYTNSLRLGNNESFLGVGLSRKYNPSRAVLTSFQGHFFSSNPAKITVSEFEVVGNRQFTTSKVLLKIIKFPLLLHVLIDILHFQL